jgi:hypothetical protein
VRNSSLQPGQATHGGCEVVGTASGVYSRSNAMGALDRIKQWFRKAGNEAETVAKGGEPDATPPSGGFGEPERETSTNAQMQGASDEPWSE